MTRMTTKRYISVWRRSETARFIDAVLADTGEIAVTDARDENVPLLADEEAMNQYSKGDDTRVHQVDAELAHRIWGWDIS